MRYVHTYIRTHGLHRQYKALVQKNKRKLGYIRDSVNSSMYLFIRGVQSFAINSLAIDGLMYGKKAVANKTMDLQQHRQQYKR